MNQWLMVNRYYGAGGGQGTHDGGFSNSSGGPGGGEPDILTPLQSRSHATHYGGGGGGCGRTGGQPSTGGSGYAGVVIIRHQYMKVKMAHLQNWIHQISLRM